MRPAFPLIAFALFAGSMPSCAWLNRMKLGGKKGEAAAEAKPEVAKKDAAAVDVATKPAEVPLPDSQTGNGPDDGLRMPDMLAMPESDELNRSNVTGVANPTTGGGTVVVRPGAEEVISPVEPKDAPSAGTGGP